MTPKKQKSKVQFEEPENNKDGDEALHKTPEQEDAKDATEQEDAKDATKHELPQNSESVQPSVTSTESAKRRYGGARGVSSMYKVVVKKAHGKKSKVRCNALGVPIGQTRHALQSYIGMLSRTMIPIDCTNWPSVDAELKEKLWLDIQVYKHITCFLLICSKLCEIVLLCDFSSA